MKSHLQRALKLHFPGLPTHWLQSIVVTALVLLAGPSHAFENSDIWQEVNNGSAIVIIRHALAPGNGDPSHFELGRCETQRNLSGDGLAQAKAIGKLLKDNGVNDPSLYTSQWCRCMDTATAMNLGMPVEKPELNSFYSNPQDGEAQTQKLIQWQSELQSNRPIVLITHQVVISALTDVYPASGEIVIFRLTKNNLVKVVKRIKTR